MPISGWGAAAIVLLGVIGLLAKRRKERWKLLEAIGQRVGHTTRAPGYLGTDYLALEGRSHGKRSRLTYYIGAEHHSAYLSVEVLVRAPEALIRPGEPVPARFDSAALEALFGLGVERVESDASGLKAVLQPVSLSDAGTAARVEAVLAELGKLARGAPALDRGAPIHIRPWSPSLMLEALALGVLAYALYRAVPGQCLDPIAAFLRAVPFGLAVVLLRDYAWRRRPPKIRANAAAAVRRAYWGLYFIVVFLAWYAVNGKFDESRPRIGTHIVEAKYLSRQKFRTIPMFKTEAGRIEVDEATFAAAEPGAWIELTVRSGRLGVPWVEKYRLSP